jgi:hypothetical protein
VFTFITCPAIFAAERTKNMTPLDEVFIAAQKDPANQANYYNLFLNTDFFIPTHDIPKEEKERRASKGESITPILVESEGVQFLMLFDTQERLSSWATREVGYARIPGHAIVEMMDSKTHWALNVGTEYFKEFVSNEIKWLKESLEHSKGRDMNVAEGTRVMIGAPAKIPNGLIESLSRKLSNNTEIIEAYLGQVHYLKENEKPHLALVLKIDSTPDSAIKAIQTDLGISTKGILGEDEYIDILIDDGSGVSSEITKAVKPFYIRNK